MSITRILAALAALWFLLAAPQAFAKEVTQRDVLACTNAWAAGWAHEHGKTIEDAMRYARRIKTEPPTTLTIDGRSFVFSKETLGATVWGTCEASLTAKVEAAAPTLRQSSVAPQPVETSPQKLLDEATAKITDLERANAAAKSNQAFMLLLGFVFGAVLGSLVVYGIMRNKLNNVQRVKPPSYTQVGPGGEQTPRQPPSL